MAERFKKGQLVPKRLGLATFRNERHRHNLVFGADVEVDGKTIRVIEGDCALLFKRGYIKRRKNGPKEISRCNIRGITVTPWKVTQIYCT